MTAPHDLRVSTFVITHDGGIYQPPDVDIPRSMSRMELYYFRKQNHLCVQCGKKLYATNRAVQCNRCKTKTSRATKRWRKRNPKKVAKQKAWLKADRKANPEKYARIQRRLYREHQRRKLCVECSKPALSGAIRCKAHRDRNRAKSLRWYRKKGRARRRELARAKL